MGVEYSNGDRSIWKATVSGDDWSHTLTCLCFSASRIWPAPNSRPEMFSGTVTPAEAGTVIESNETDKPKAPTATVTQPSNEIENETTGFDPVSFFSGTQTETASSETEHIVSNNQISIPGDSAPVGELNNDDEAPGKLFRAWLHDGLLKDKFETNSVNARIHRVEEGLLLVSPGIFKDFDRENWQKSQKRFQKLKLHRKTTQGTNIYTYQVTGKRSRSRIKGFLIEEPEKVFEGVTFPPPNPYLKLAEQ